jgi:hypothetical protein
LECKAGFCRSRDSLRTGTRGYRNRAGVQEIGQGERKKCS